MQGIFDDATGQYIDTYGKTRMIVYRDQTALMTSPIPPLALKRISLEPIPLTTIENALKFVERKGLQIVSQDGTPKDGIQGIWIEPKQENPGIYYGYIPLKKTRFIKDVPEAQRSDPLRTDISSELDEYRRSRKIAEVLKQYTLYTYARSEHPESFDEDDFVVNDKHVYNLDLLEKKFIKDTPVIYWKGKIIVPNEQTRDHLLSYLEAMVANDKDGVMAMKDSQAIEGYYQNLSDFRSSVDQLVFTSKNAVMRWRNSRILEEGKTRSEVMDVEDQDTLEPYYYRNPKIKREHLMIVQNVIDFSEKSTKGDSDLELSRDRAISVAYRWLKDNTNAMADAPILDNVANISYVIYSREQGFNETRVQRKTKEYVSLIKYANGRYGALLFFP